MKKLLLTVLLFAVALVGFAQTTYYWVGGTTPTSFTSNSNWNTALDGTGTVRLASAATDILIFDGSNVGGTIPATGLVTATTGVTNFRQLILVNNANVTIERNAVGGTATVTVNGDGTATDDVQIPIGSTLTIKSQTGDNTGSVNLTLTTAAATAKVFGTLNINGGGCRISSATANSVLFESNSICNINTVLSGQYPFSSNNFKQVLFKSGSKLNFLGGNSLFTNTPATEPVVFETGSSIEFAANVPTTNSTSVHFFNGRIYPNIIIANNATVIAGTLNALQNLTVNTGSTFNFATDGVVPIYGNVVNNGMIGVSGVGSSNLLFVGNASNQTLGGTGSYNLGALTIGSDAKVQLLRSVNLVGESQSSVLGELNFGAFSINGLGTTANTGRFQSRTSVNVSTTTATITSNTSTVTFATPADYTALSPNIGMLVTGTQIPSSTYIIGTNSSTSTLTLSKNATAAGSSLTVFSPNPTLITANPSGINGSVVVNANGTLSFAAGTHYTFNAATSAPFSTLSINDIGNLTINASVTTNRNATVIGNIILGSSKLTVSEGNELTVSPTTMFSGMSTTAYIATSANTGTGAIGTVKVAGLSASKMFPIGSAANYLPVTLAPVNSSDFTINAFQGASANAQSNGTALTAGQKADLVDAIYNIVRSSGTGNCNVTLGWDGTLEGSTFTGLADGAIGIANYNTSYSSFVAATSANNTTNTATFSTTVFEPFLIGKVGTLPVSLISFTAKAVNQTAALVWQTTSEVNLSKYEVQRSSDGVNFQTLGSVKANNKAGVFNYTFTDRAPGFGANYYRLLSIDLDGTTATSKPLSVNFGAVATLSVYPNPTTNEVNINGLVKGDVVTLSDLVGRTLQSKIYQGENIMNMNLSDSNAGVYFISVSRGGKTTSTNKIVKN